MRFLVLTFVTTLLVSCCGCGSKYGGHDKIKKVEGQIQTVFPGKNVVFSDVTKNAIDKAVYIRDLFPVQEIVMLEVTEESVIGEITDVAYINGNWFVFDFLQNQVLKFDFNGTFLAKIGKQGGGPGEYRKLATMEHCFGNNLAVLDGGQGKIIVYNEYGDHVKTFNGMADGERYIPNYSFIWEDESSLYLSCFASFNDRAPWHVILDPSTAKGSVVGGFGERFIPAVRARYNKVFSSFRKIDGYIWVGSPFKSTLEIYSKNGHFIGPLGEIPPDGITEDDFDGVDLTDRVRRRLPFKGKKSNVWIFPPVGNLVVVCMTGSWFDLYDVKGNIIKTGLRNKKLTPILESFDNIAVSMLRVHDNMELYAEDDLLMLLEKGWDPEKNSDDNPYLRLGAMPQ